MNTTLSKCLMCGEREVASERATCCVQCAKADDERIERENQEFMKRTQLKIQEQRMLSAGVSEAYLNRKLTLDTWYQDTPMDEQRLKEKMAIVACHEWAKELGETPHLYLFGKPGLGKSHMAKAALVEAIGLQKGGRYLKFGALLDELRDAMFTEDVSDVVALDRYKSVSMLVLDDIGASEKLGDFAVRTLYTILDYRIENELPLLLTANYSLKQLMEVLALGGRNEDAIESRRICERIHGNFVIKELTGKTYRGRKDLR